MSSSFLFCRVFFRFKTFGRNFKSPWFEYRHRWDLDGFLCWTRNSCLVYRLLINGWCPFDDFISIMTHDMKPFFMAPLQPLLPKILFWGRQNVHIKYVLSTSTNSPPGLEPLPLATVHVRHRRWWRRYNLRHWSPRLRLLEGTDLLIWKDHV